MKFYKYLFFKIYNFFSIINNEMPSFLAMMAMSWLLLINSLTVIGFIFIKNNHLAVLYSKTGSVIFTLTIIGLHYFYFSYKRKYLKIIKEFENSDSKSILGILGVILYVFLTFWVFFKYIVPNIEGIA